MFFVGYVNMEDFLGKQSSHGAFLTGQAIGEITACSVMLTIPSICVCSYANLHDEDLLSPGNTAHEATTIGFDAP